MEEELDVNIVTYHPKMAEDLAAMYNTWDNLWIGGFTQGVPFDAQRVRDRYDKMSAIDILIAVKKSDSKPVGSCTLHEHWRDRDAAYVGVLGVSPEALGKKVGKKLLLRAIEIVRFKGYERVDLNTWAGNMRAVPLYKKVGLMWNPEGEGVHMEDYIPGILEHPLCKPFFENMTENEWYEWLQRDVKQSPDRMKHKNMDVYEYKFQRGEDTLTVMVDRHARGIFSVDRQIDEERFSITANIEDHEVLCGIPTQYVLEIRNETQETKSIDVQLGAFEALTFNEESSAKLQIEPGEIREWSVPLIIHSTAPIHRKTRRTPEILTELTVDGISIPLHTGLVIQPIADVQDRYPHSRVVPGGSVEVPLIVLSSMKKEIAANLILEPSDSSLSVQPEKIEMSIPSEGISGVIAQVNANDNTKTGSYCLGAKIELVDTFADEPQRVVTRTFEIPIFCGESGAVNIFEDRRNKDIIVSGINYQATFSIEGANLNIRDIYSGQSLFRARSQIGPPFGIDTFRFAEREHFIETGNDGVTVAMRGTHPDRPLIIEDCVHFERNSGIIRHEVWTRNTSKDSQDFQLRVYGGGQGISLSPGEVIVPIGDRIVRQPLLHGLFTHPSVPSSPDAFHEGWVAAKRRGVTKGQAFDFETLDEVHLGSDQMAYVQYPLSTIAPGESKSASRYWLKTNANSWKQIRQLWMEKVRRVSSTTFDDKKSRKTTDMICITTEPCIINEKRECEIQFRIEKSIVAPLSADIFIEPPTGWSARFLNDRETKDASSNHLGKIDLEKNQEFVVQLSPTDEVSEKFGIHRGSIILQAATTYRKDFFIVQFGKSDIQVQVKEVEDEGVSSYEVKNGLIDFRLSHKYGGCIYSLRNKRGTQLLFSTFPEGGPKPGAFFDNYHGGIQPITWDSELGEELSNAETNKEHMTARILEAGPWRGVEFGWVGKIQKPLHGVQFTLQYLTAPSSRLIAARWIVKNITNAPVRLRPTFLVDPAFDGEVSSINVRTHWEGHPQKVKPASYPISLVSSSNSIFIENTAMQEDNEGLGIAAPFEDSELLLVVAGDLILTGSTGSNHQLMPGDEYISTTWFLIDPESEDEILSLQNISHELI